MVKKIVCLVAVFVLCFSISVCAEDELLVYGKDDLTAVLNMTENEIAVYCEQNNITYFAVNNNNTKQVKKTETLDAFSKKTVDFSAMDDEEIVSLEKELSGFENAKGEVVSLNGYKLLKCELKTSDSGGEYVLTQFVTVKNAKKITLSFYTADSADRGYIDGVLDEQFPKEKNLKPIVIAGVVIFSVMALGALLLVIKDLRTKGD